MRPKSIILLSVIASVEGIIYKMMIMKNKILLMIIIVLFIGGYGVFFSLVNAKPISDLALTYELGNCDKDSPGNCCLNSRIGEVRNIISN